MSQTQRCCCCSCLFSSNTLHVLPMPVREKHLLFSQPLQLPLMLLLQLTRLSMMLACKFNSYIFIFFSYIRFRTCSDASTSKTTNLLNHNKPTRCLLAPPSGTLVTVPRVRKLHTEIVPVVFVGRVLSVVFLILRSSHIQRSSIVFVIQACM